MSKLSAKDQFLDLSDYGRPFAQFFAQKLKDTRITPIHVTLLFGFVGMLAVVCIFYNYYALAAICIVLKSIIDAVDGELARAKQTPSYVGRYLDSIFDILLNAILFTVIGSVVGADWWMIVFAFCCIQLQGTLYNYYYVILRNQSEGGDTTSKIFEHSIPLAFPGEKQKWVTRFYFTYKVVYGLFDYVIHQLDSKAYLSKRFPNWFMTLLSVYGLGFQLAIMAFLIALNRIQFIIPFFIYYTFLMFLLIVIRKNLLKK